MCVGYLYAQHAPLFTYCIIISLLTPLLYYEHSQCLVGFTPFYSEEPVITCKKILRWEQFLDIPEEVAASLSAECLDFMLSLLTDSKDRYSVLCVGAVLLMCGVQIRWKHSR